jgi:hypothetical protein
MSGSRVLCSWPTREPEQPVVVFLAAGKGGLDPHHSRFQKSPERQAFEPALTPRRRQGGHCSGGRYAEGCFQL